MKKTIITVICLALAAILLQGCTKASELVPDTTKKPEGIIPHEGNGSIDKNFKDYVICSDNFALYSGEYAYFFLDFFGSSAEQIENTYGVDLSKGLKDQYISNSDSITWFDFFRDQTLLHMKELLYVYELAIESGKGYEKNADEYLNSVVIPAIKQESGGNPSEYIYEKYAGLVLYQNYLNALYLEFIYESYTSDVILETFDSLSDAEVKEFADSLEGEKDETKTRLAVYVRVPDGHNKSLELLEEFSEGEQLSPDALEALAKKKGLICFNDAFTPDDKTHKEISDWLFSADRETGDLGAVEIKDDSHYAVFYYGEGDPVYLYNARRTLSQKKTYDGLLEKAEASESILVNKERLNDLEL